MRTVIPGLLAVLLLGACKDYPPGESPKEKARAAALHSDAVHRVGQARYAISQGDYEQANIHAQWAVVADPNYAVAYDLLAWISLNLGNDQLQLSAALEAVRLAPDSASYRHTLGVMFEDMGRTRNAQEAYADAVRMNPADTTAWLDLARVAYENRSFAAADSAFRMLEELTPAHFDTATADARMRDEARAAVGR